MKNIFLILLLLAASAFAELNIVDIFTASNNIIVVRVDADTASRDSIPNTTTTNYQINGVAPDTIGRYSYTRDQGVYYTGGANYLVYTTHHLYLRMVDSLVNDSSYSITTPFGTDTLVYSNEATRNESIKVNQVGYDPYSTKLYANFGIFAGDLRHQYLDTVTPPTYYIMDTVTREKVYSGQMAYWGVDTATIDSSTTDPQGASVSGEIVFRIDLDTVPPGGPYYVVIPGFGRSYPFNIGREWQDTLALLHMRGLYHQRCGIALEKRYTDWTRGKCHDQVALEKWTTWGATTFITVDTATDNMTSIRGGYHDAGDYDRRPQHTLIPTVMFTLFEAFPERFTDGQYNIPESGNGIPDFLDEALWGQLVWEYLQIDSSNFPDSTSWWGAVLQGTETSAHPEYGVARADRDYKAGVQLFYGAFAPRDSITAVAAGMFAQSSRLIEPYDSARSAQLMAKAQAAWDWVWANDTSQVESELLYAALQMYLATVTGDSATDYDNLYHQIFRDRFNFYVKTNSGTWPHQYSSGNLSGKLHEAHFVSYSLGTHTKDSTIDYYIKARMDTVSNTGGYQGWTEANYPYAQGVVRFLGWGSGTAQGRYCQAPMYAYKFATTDSARQHHYDIVAQLSNYSVGLNPLGRMYVSGDYGSNQLQAPLHLDSYWSKYGEIPGSNYTRTALGNVPGIVSYGPYWYKSGTTYERINTDRVYPLWAWNDSLYPGVVTGYMPGQRRFTDAWSTIVTGEFTTWETILWNATMYSFLNMPNEPNLDSLHEVSNNNLLSINSYKMSLTDTSTYVKLDATFPGLDTLFVTLTGATDTLRDTILPNTGQNMFTVNATALPSGTYFVNANSNPFGIVTKGF